MSLFKQECHDPDDRGDRDERGTPREFHRPVAQAVGGFDLDPASGAEQHPTAETRWTKDDDGLSRQWFGTVWLNPPFTKKDRWIRKARSALADDDVDTIVVLLPVDTSAGWFHEHVAPAAEAVCFVEGRLSFDGVDGAPNFGVMLVVMGECPRELLDVLDSKGAVYRSGEQHEQTRQAELSDATGA